MSIGIGRNKCGAGSPNRFLPGRLKRDLMGPVGSALEPECIPVEVRAQGFRFMPRNSPAASNQPRKRQGVCPAREAEFTDFAVHHPALVVVPTMRRHKSAGARVTAARMKRGNAPSARRSHQAGAHAP